MMTSISGDACSRPGRHHDDVVMPVVSSARARPSLAPSSSSRRARPRSRKRFEPGEAAPGLPFAHLEGGVPERAARPGTLRRRSRSWPTDCPRAGVLWCRACARSVRNRALRAAALTPSTSGRASDARAAPRCRPRRRPHTALRAGYARSPFFSGGGTRLRLPCRAAARRAIGAHRRFHRGAVRLSVAPSGRPKRPTASSRAAWEIATAPAPWERKPR
jgi:hypothetical protein